MTKLDVDGDPISPNSSSSYGSDGGYRYRFDGESGFQSPQSSVITADGSIWVSNVDGDAVSQLVGGDPDNIVTWGADPSCTNVFAKPWGLASDDTGHVFVTNTAGRNVSMIDPTTAPDSLCPSATHQLDSRAAPQGIATDFEGNLWVADFWSKRIHNLCGDSGNCPEGMQALGQHISPPGRSDSTEAGMGGGYGANATLQSITGSNIDQAGNVWVADNANRRSRAFFGVQASMRGSTSIPNASR
jgi:hypothetical protein